MSDDGDDDSTREIQLVENEGGWWTVVDSDRGAVGDAPTKAEGLALMEEIIEDIDDASIPDVEPAEPSEEPERESFPPQPSSADDAQ